MTKKINVAFDIDGCVVDLMAQLREKLAENDIKYIENGHYKPKTNPKISNTRLWEYIHLCYQNHKDTPVYDGASELFENLYNKTEDPITFVTSRPHSSASHTHKLISRICKPPYQICFAKEPFHKLDYIKNFNFFVEDHRKLALEIADTGTKLIFMPDRSYNAMPFHKFIWRISGINDLNKFIDQLIA